MPVFAMRRPWAAVWAAIPSTVPVAPTTRERVRQQRPIGVFHIVRSRSTTYTGDERSERDRPEPSTIAGCTP